MIGSFTEYRQTRDLADLCVQHDIDLAPLIEELDSLMCDTDLAPEEIYNEFLQRAANWVGNMAGKAVRGIGNTVNNFKQGYQQGRGPQQQPQQAQQPQHDQQPAPQQQGGNGPSIQLALHHLQSLKQNLQASQQQSNQLAQHLYGTTQYLDQISQMIQQVLQARYGINWKPH